MPRRGPSRFALLVGFALFTSGWAKATTGWLNPDLKCTYGHLATNYLVTGRETWAAKLALPIQSAWFWKGADWATVALELAVLPAALRRRSFCLVLALVTVFHVGVMLLFDISFRVNVIAYGAFVRYADLPVMASLGARPLSRKVALVAFVAACACGLTGTLLGRGLVGTSLDEIIVGIGGLVGVVYLLRGCAGRWRRRFRFRSIADKRPLVGNRRPRVEGRPVGPGESERTVDQWGCRASLKRRRRASPRPSPTRMQN